MRPIWFIDIDGSLNISSPIQVRHQREFPDYIEITVNRDKKKPYPFRYSPSVVNFINKMSEKMDIVFLTNWNEALAKETLDAIGMVTYSIMSADGEPHPQNFPHMTIDEVDKKWWKFKLILKHVKDIGPDFIWSDDELNDAIRRYVRRNADFEGIESLLLKPDSEFGVTTKDFVSIENFVGLVTRNMAS